MGGMLCHPMYRLFRPFFFALLILMALPILAMVSCQHKLIYFPRSYPPSHDEQWQQQTRGKILACRTSAGHQQAYLFCPRPQEAPQRLWLVCGGNGTLATEWSSFMKYEAPAEDAYLLIDYPGYGNNEGTPSPAKIRETLRQIIPLAAADLGWNEVELRERTRIFGHSLGCAVALIGAEEFSLRRGVLLAPFTSTMDMSREVTGLDLGFLVTHRFDNQHVLQQISADSEARIHLFHGLTDGVIPPTMSCQLHRIAPPLFPLTLCENCGHNDWQIAQTQKIVAAMKSVE
jgi:pimeloyl-ACP methyl ester carboxylesterase